MTMTVARFRREVERRRGTRRRGAPRYDDALVEFAVAHARAVRSQGGSVNAASRELGLSAMTLGKWVSRGASGAQGAFREVVLSSAAPLPSSPSRAGTLTLTTASGHVVTGLDVSQAAALLGALS
jgi:transposase-like protein